MIMLLVVCLIGSFISYVIFKFKRRVQYISIHEAGHAVVCEHLNIPWLEAIIASNGGHVTRQASELPDDCLVSLGGFVATRLYNDNFPEKWLTLEYVKEDIGKFNERSAGTKWHLASGIKEVEKILVDNKDRVMEIARELQLKGKCKP